MSKEKKIIPALRFPEFANEQEWHVKPLDEVCELVRGPFGGALKKEIFVKDGYAVYEQSHAIYSDFSSFRYKIDDTKFSELRRFAVKAGDIIMSCSGTMGKFAIIPKEYEQGVINQALLKLTTRKSYDNIFIKKSLETESNQNKLLSQSAGGAIKNVVSVAQIRELGVAIPSPKEQHKIVACLSSLDDLLEAHNQKLASLIAHKKGLMQNLFPQEGEKVPKLRFPEFENDGAWKIKRFEELFEIGNGRDYKHLGKGNIPVYGSGGYMLSVDDYLYDGESACIGRKGTINKPIFLTGKFWTVDTLFYTHSFKECLPKFIYYIFQNINWLNHNEAGGVPSLSKTNIYKIETLVPEPNEQKRILDLLTGIDALISAQINKLEQLNAHKKGLSQRLFPNSVI
jgi:type I restriction enzyme S subunit